MIKAQLLVVLSRTFRPMGEKVMYVVLFIAIAAVEFVSYVLDRINAAVEKKRGPPIIKGE